MGETRERIIQIMMVGDPFGSAANIAGEIDAKDKRIAELEGLLREAETMIKNADVSVNTLTKAGDMLAARLDQALAEVAAKAQHIAELEQRRGLIPVRAGDVSLLMGLTKEGEARVVFDGRDPAAVAAVAEAFALTVRMSEASRS